MSLSIILRVAIAIAVVAGEQCLHNDLALLQTIIQVDGGEISTDTGSIASSRGFPKLHACPVATEVLVGISVFITVVAGGAFVQKINANAPTAAIGKDDRIEVDNCSASSCSASNGNLAVNGDGISPAAAEVTPTEEKEPIRMTWAVYILGICYMMLQCFATDQYVPQMPEMAAEMHCTQTQMGATLQINWMLKAIVAFFAGALSDRIGRRPIIMLGCFLLSLSCFACAGCGSIHWFYAARAIQGVGEGAEGVIVSTYRDCYDDVKQRVRVSSASIAVMAIAPIVAPSIGGVISKHTGSWRYSFILFGLVGGALTSSMAILWKETLPPKKENDESSVIQVVKKVVFDKHLVTILCLTTFVTVTSMVGASANAFIFIREYHKTPLFYARMNAVNAITAVVGIALAQPLLHLSPVMIMRISLTITGLCGVAIIPMSMTSLIHSIWFFMGSSWVTIIVSVPAWMAMSPLYLEQMKHSSGVANGLQSLVTNFGGSIISHALSYIVAPNGAHGMLYVTASLHIFMVTFFWVMLGFAPPPWACEHPKAEDDDGVEKAICH